MFSFLSGGRNFKTSMWSLKLQHLSSLGCLKKTVKGPASGKGVGVFLTRKSDPLKSWLDEVTVCCLEHWNMRTTRWVITCIYQCCHPKPQHIPRTTSKKQHHSLHSAACYNSPGFWKAERAPFTPRKEPKLDPELLWAFRLMGLAP